MCPGLLETRFYAMRGIPAYAYRTGLLTVSHGPSEFVPVPQHYAMRLDLRIDRGGDVC